MATMRAVTVLNKVLQISSGVATPQPLASLVKVGVRATALNRADCLQRKGLYPPPPGDSEIIGLEFAGVVEELGPDVPAGALSVGDKIFGLVGGGGYAEKLVIDYRMCMRVPEGWEFEKAAAVPEAYLTAHRNLFQVGNLKKGESVLIHAGGSGVGTAAIQLAKSAGASHVYATVGSKDKADKLLELGCTKAILYKETDFATAIKEETGGAGVDVVLDCIGAKYLDSNVSILKVGGRLVNIGLMGGAKAELDMAQVLRRRLQILGSVLRPLSLEQKITLTDEFQTRFMPELASGSIKVVIHEVMPWADAQKGHDMMEANENFGKIVFRVD